MSNSWLELELEHLHETEISVYDLQFNSYAYSRVDSAYFVFLESINACISLLFSVRESPRSSDM